VYGRDGGYIGGLWRRCLEYGAYALSQYGGSRFLYPSRNMNAISIQKSILAADVVDAFSLEGEVSSNY